MKNIFDSVKNTISLISILLIVLLMVVTIVIASNAFRNTVEQAYLNQLTNFNQDIENQMVNFYETQTKYAQFLASDSIIVNAVLTEDYRVATEILTSLFEETELYENIFISTASRNTEIVADPGTGSIGQRWASGQYEKNLTSALRGDVYVNIPQKAPKTGLMVSLITAPIKYDGKVIGILGLPVDLSDYLVGLVENVKMGKTGYPFIADVEGLAIGHPNREQVGKINLKDMDWGRQVLSSPSGHMFRYEWEGKKKLLTFVRNELYGFYVVSTIYDADIAEDASRTATLLAIVGIVGVLLAVGVLYFILSKRLNPLQDAVFAANELSEGNLKVSFKQTRNDEIGQVLQALERMVKKLQSIVVDVQSASGNVSSGSEALSSSSQEMSQGATEQASSAEEASSSMEQMASNIQQNADNATQTEKIAIKAAADAQESGQAVNEAVTAMNEIAEKINIIQEIARSTNMLALNAAIEAARAGEQGKGFAVVAAEVRRLAERSQKAAAEIGTLSHNSVEVAQKAGTMLKQLVPDIQKTAELVQEISAASNEQRTGVDQVNQALQQLDTVIQQNASSAEEMASTSEELASQAQQLQSTMGFFKVDENHRSQKRIRISQSRPGTRNEVKTTHSFSEYAENDATVAMHIEHNGAHDQEDDAFELY